MPVFFSNIFCMLFASEATMIAISSKDNKYIKLARSLQNKKGRALSGCFLIEGMRLSEEALSADIEICFALMEEEALANPRIAALVNQLATDAVPVYSLAAALFRFVTATEHSQGIALVAKKQRSKLIASGNCWAICDNIADPGNLGAIIRSAYAAGVGMLLLTPQCVDIYNPKVVRSAMGALFRLPVYAAESDEAAYQLTKERQLFITAANGQDIRQISERLTSEHVWVLGSEAEGVSPFWQQKADLAVSLPMREGAESLNVAAAATVLFYESFFAVSC